MINMASPCHISSSRSSIFNLKTLLKLTTNVLMYVNLSRLMSRWLAITNWLTHLLTYLSVFTCRIFGKKLIRDVHPNNCLRGTAQLKTLQCHISWPNFKAAQYYVLKISENIIGRNSQIRALVNTTYFMNLSHAETLWLCHGRTVSGDSLETQCMREI
jgi:hypothetical protein